MGGKPVKHDEIEELVSELVTEIISDTDLELVDVEYVRERDWYLRVYLDKESGLDLDDCELVSRKLSEILDAKDPIKENYLLEVSSPGLDRVLKKEKDFIRYRGRDVDVQLFKPYDGEKQFTGALKSFTDTTITITVNKEDKIFERKDMAQMRLHLDF